MTSRRQRKINRANSAAGLLAEIRRQGTRRPDSPGVYWWPREAEACDDLSPDSARWRPEAYRD